MSEPVPAVPTERCEYLGVYSEGVIHLSAGVNWAEGTPVLVRVADVDASTASVHFGKVIIAGFGLAGRWIAEIFDRHGVEYVVVDANPQTVETQCKLGRRAICGNISDEDTLQRAGITDASILALTIPDEQALRRATQAAKRLNPAVYVVGRTMYSSSGMQAEQLGADEVVKVEQVVARQFYEMLLRKLTCQQGDGG